MVDGKFVVRDRKAVRVDEVEVLRRAQDAADGLIAKAKR
jgi:hypothetical protein